MGKGSAKGRKGRHTASLREQKSGRAGQASTRVWNPFTNVNRARRHPSSRVTNDGPPICEMTQCDDPESIPPKTRVIVFFTPLSVTLHILSGLRLFMRVISRMCHVTIRSVPMCAYVYIFDANAERIDDPCPIFWDWLDNPFIFGCKKNLRVAKAVVVRVRLILHS